MSQVKKIYYAIKNKDGNFFAGWDSNLRKDIFLSSHYYLYDLQVAKSRLKNISNPNELTIIQSPIQDDSVWNESSPYESNKKK